MSKQEKLEVNAFINIVLIESVGQCVRTGNEYLSAGIIAQGIELIGSIIENEEDEKLKKKESDFDTKWKSRERFYNALMLFDSKYHILCSQTEKTANVDFDLYSNLRCGYAHQLRPTGRVHVFDSNKAKEEGFTHLVIDSRNILPIVVSELFSDFKKVCGFIISQIESDMIKHPKAYSTFLYV